MPRSHRVDILAPVVVLAGVLGGCSPSPAGQGMPPASASPGTGAARPSASSSGAPASPVAPATEPSASPPSPTASPPRCAEDASVAEARWVERSDGIALRVVPTEELRGCGGPLLGTPDVLPGWDDLVRRVPEADVPGLRDQYACHLRLAPRKELWHLEPWRPVVPPAQMLGSLCNPGAADLDLGAG